jgi:hypothetical protein
MHLPPARSRRVVLPEGHDAADCCGGGGSRKARPLHPPSPRCQPGTFWHQQSPPQVHEESRIKNSEIAQLEPSHRPPPRRRHPHRAARRQRDGAPGRLPHHRQQDAAPAPWPAQVGNLDPDNVVRRLDRDRHRLAGSTRAAVPETIGEKPTSKTPRPRTGGQGLAPLLRTRGRPAPAPPARQASRSPGPPDQPSARPVRGRPWKTDGVADRTTGPDAVRYTSVDTATSGSTTLQGDTRRDRGETARITENS